MSKLKCLGGFGEKAFGNQYRESNIGAFEVALDRLFTEVSN